MRRAIVILLASALAACSAVNDPGRHMGGPPPSGDAGGGMDAGGSPDTGPGDDDGGTTDAGDTTDAGGPRDGGGTTDAGMDAGLGPIGPVDLCDELVAMACEAKLRCCSSTMQTMEQCRIALEPGCSSALESLAVDMRTGYDPDIAREVVEEGRALAASCDTDILDWFADRDGLMRMFQGTAPAGANCTVADPGSFWSCRLPRICIPQLIGRECRPARTETEACRGDPDCDTGLFCRRPTIMLGSCELRHADGGSCMRNIQCQSLICDTRGSETCLPRTVDLYCNIRLDG